MNSFLEAHPWAVFRAGDSEPVARFTNWFAANDTVRFRSAPQGNGGDGVEHWIEKDGVRYERGVYQ